MTGPCRCPTCSDFETCDLCHEPAGDELWEWGNKLICKKCHESRMDQAEAEHEQDR